MNNEQLIEVWHIALEDIKGKDEEIERYKRCLCAIWDCKYEADKILCFIEKAVSKPVKEFFYEYKDKMYKEIKKEEANENNRKAVH